MLNTLERIQIPLQKLIGGAEYNLSAFRIKSKSPGPHVHIQSSVHGAEVQGNAVIHALMTYFSENQFSGSITFIPHANPMATNNKSGTYTQGRFNPTTGENWNRIYTDIATDPLFSIPDKIDSFAFKKLLVETINQITERESIKGISIEKKLGLLLQKLAAPADIVLDLHTGPVATRYLYVGEYARKKSQSFPFPYKIIIPNEFAGAMDEATFMPWLSALNSLTDLTEDTIPFESYTVELGSEEEINLEEAKKDVELIISLLADRGIVEHSGDKQWPQSKTADLKDYKSYYAPKTGLIEYIGNPGSIIKEGELLYRILDFSELKESSDLTKCLTEVTAQEDSIIINHNPSANVHEGTMVYQLLTQYT